MKTKGSILSKFVPTLANKKNGDNINEIAPNTKVDNPDIINSPRFNKKVNGFKPPENIAFQFSTVAWVWVVVLFNRS